MSEAIGTCNFAACWPGEGSWPQNIRSSPVVARRRSTSKNSRAVPLRVYAATPPYTAARWFGSPEYQARHMSMSACGISKEVGGHGVLPGWGSGMARSLLGGQGELVPPQGSGGEDGVPECVDAMVGDLDGAFLAAEGGLVVPRVAADLCDQFLA